MLKTLSLLALLLASPAHAALYEMDFTATHFVFFDGSPAGPDVSGAFTYTANAPGGPITTITAVTMTIAGHAYTVGEVGFLDLGANPTGEVGLIGGTINGVNQINAGTTDFFLMYYIDLLQPTRLDYVSGAGNSPTSQQFSAFSVHELQTPLPAALPLFASGLGALWFVVRRKKKPRTVRG